MSDLVERQILRSKRVAFWFTVEAVHSWSRYFLTFAGSLLRQSRASTENNYRGKRGCPRAFNRFLLPFFFPFLFVRRSAGRPKKKSMLRSPTERSRKKSIPPQAVGGGILVPVLNAARRRDGWRLELTTWRPYWLFVSLGAFLSYPFPPTFLPNLLPTPFHRVWWSFVCFRKTNSFSPGEEAATILLS